MSVRHTLVVVDDLPASSLRQKSSRCGCACGGRIEAAWEARGLPTFKSYLREDLAHRRGVR